MDIEQLKFRVTRFERGYWAEGYNQPPAGVVETWSWDELVKERLGRQPSVGQKGYLPQLFPGTFVPGADRRKESLVEQVCLLALDFDGISLENLAKVVLALQESGLAYVSTPTYSHNPETAEAEEHYRCRYFVPLDEPIKTKDVFKFLWREFCTRLGVSRWVDHESEHFNKAYLEPARPEDVPWDPLLCEVVEGQPLRVSDYVSEDALQRLADLQAAQAVAFDRKFEAFNSQDLLAIQKKRVTPKNASWLGPLKDALKGEAYAASGSREVTLKSIAWALAREFPSVDPVDLAEPFRQSVQVTEELGDGDNAGVTFEDFVMKLDSAQIKLLQEQAVAEAREAVQEKQASEEADKLNSAFKRLQKHHPQGPDFINAKELFVRDQTSGSYYVFSANLGTHTLVHPTMISMLARSQASFWSKAFGFQFYRPGAGFDDDGKAKPLTLDDEKSVEWLLKDYGTECESVEYRTFGHGFFDRDRRVLVCTKVKDPCEEWSDERIYEVEQIGKTLLKREEELQQDLGKLQNPNEKAALVSAMAQSWEAGEAPDKPDFRYLREALRHSFQNGSRDLEDFEQYLSRVRNTNQPSKILAVIGRAASGKDALLKTVARSVGGFVSGERCLTRFAVGIEASRVWMFSEDLPRDRFGNVVTQKLREVVTQEEHNLEMKGQQQGVKLFGYPRLMTSLQDSSKLNFGETAHTRDDIEALNERFLIFQFNRNARNILHRGFWDLVEKHELMQEYILYAERCVAQVALASGEVGYDRFGYLRGGDNRLSALTDVPSVNLLTTLWELLYRAVLQTEHIGRYCGNVRLGSTPPVFVNKGAVYFSPNSFYANWDSYVPGHIPRPKTIQEFMRTVKAISTTGKKIRVRLGHDRPGYYEVSRKALKEQAILMEEPEKFELRMDISENLDFRDKRFQLSELDVARNRERVITLNPRVKLGQLSAAKA